MPLAWTCTDVGSSTNCVVTATSTAPIMNANEWLVIMGTIIFLLSIPVWARLFGWVNELPKL